MTTAPPTLTDRQSIAIFVLAASAKGVSLMDILAALGVGRVDQLVQTSFLVADVVMALQLLDARARASTSTRTTP